MATEDKTTKFLYSVMDGKGDKLKPKNIPKDYYGLKPAYTISSVMLAFLSICQGRHKIYRLPFAAPKILELIGFQVLEVKRKERDFYIYIDEHRVKVAEKVYRKHKKAEDKERYFMERLKKGRAWKTSLSSCVYLK